VGVCWLLPRLYCSSRAHQLGELCCSRQHTSWVNCAAAESCKIWSGLWDICGRLGLAVGVLAYVKCEVIGVITGSEAELRSLPGWRASTERATSTYQQCTNQRHTTGSGRFMYPSAG
jgi:hypothetical protein